MPARPALVSQTEITRCLKAAQAAGIAVARYEVTRDGKVIVYSTADRSGEVANDWDRP